MPVYNKLVRDRIPEIIEKAGKKYTISKLDEENYVDALKQKLMEEVAEYEAATADEDAIEELADILEVISALCAIHGVTTAQVEAIRKRKAEQRGGFSERIFLHEVED